MFENKHIHSHKEELQQKHTFGTVGSKTTRGFKPVLCAQVYAVFYCTLFSVATWCSV